MAGACSWQLSYLFSQHYKVEFAIWGFIANHILEHFLLFLLLDIFNLDEFLGDSASAAKDIRILIPDLENDFQQEDLPQPSLAWMLTCSPSQEGIEFIISHLGIMLSIM